MISIPGKHGYKPDPGHDAKTGFTEQVAGLRLKISNYCSLPLFFFLLIMSTGCFIFIFFLIRKRQRQKYSPYPACSLEKGALPFTYL